MTDDYFRGVAQWSPDGTPLWHIARKILDRRGPIWSGRSRVGSKSHHGVRRDRIGMGLVMDGKDLLVSQKAVKNTGIEVWLLPYRSATCRRYGTKRSFPIRFTMFIRATSLRRAMDCL